VNREGGAMAEEVIGRNLLRIRRARGLTQEELASRAGLSRVGYRNIESGKSLPRVETLRALASALETPLRDLVFPVQGLACVRFRSSGRLNSREQILAQVSQWLEDFNELEGALGDRVPFGLADFIPPQGASPLERARLAAGAVRSTLGIGDKEPIRDICGLLEARGIKVFSVRLAAKDFFGLSVGVGGSGPAIVVNTWERISVERWIFTAAHELGHLVLHHDDYDVAQLGEEKSHEQEANVFASHFLMPDSVFWKEWGETAGLPLVDRVLKVKRIFRVSYRTVLYRVSERVGPGVNVWLLFQNEHRRSVGRTLLRVEEPEALVANTYQASFPESTRAGEPDVLSPRDFKGDRLSRLVRRGVEEGGISMARGAEILRLPLQDMRHLAGTWVRSL